MSKSFVKLVEVTLRISRCRALQLDGPGQLFQLASLIDRTIYSCYK